MALALVFFAPVFGHGQIPLTWPKAVAAPAYDVRFASEQPAAPWVAYSSPHFEMTSELKLPLGIVRDLAAVFEATRAAVRAVPLGLNTASESLRFPVRLCASSGSYAAAGGPPGTGGYFSGREMLVLLPNVGIRATTNGFSSEHTRHLFVLKHEVAHQVIGAERVRLPMWLNEGLAETFAAAPYVRGRYTFDGLDSALRDYLLKWRRQTDRRSLRIIFPAQLMAMSRSDWQREVTAQQAYDLYNSAALLTHWFLHHDGRGDSAGMAAYLDALRRRVPAEEAEATFLLRGRTREQLAVELRALARRMALEIRE